MASTPARVPQPDETAALALCASAAVLKHLRSLRLEPGLRLEARLGGPADAGHQARALEADVLILDFTPEVELGAGRLETVALISKTLPVIGLLRPGDTAPREKLLDAGVLGLLPANASAPEFSAALHAVRAQLVVIGPALLSREPGARGVGLAAEEYEGAPEDERLTPRETEVLQLMAEGYSNKEIADLLAISSHTAKFHVSSVLGKLGVESRAEAAMEGIRSGRVVI